MSDYTVRSLLELISSNRRAREENTRTMERVAPVERPWWNMQIAVFDQGYREQLDAIDEIPELLVLAPRLQEGWPYPPDDAIQVFRADLTHKAGKPVQEVDELPLRDAVAVMRGQSLRQPPPEPPIASAREEITGAQIAALPRWARVAFAARCARRGQVLLAELATQAPSDELKRLDDAVQLAEESAATGKTKPNANQIATDVLEEARQSATSAAAAGRTRINGTPVIALLWDTVGQVVAAAAKTAVEGNPSLAFHTFKIAEQAAHLLSSTTLLEGMRRDFAYLDLLAKKRGWTDQTPVPPAVIPQPRLRLAALHIRGLMAVRQLDLPEDGLGWNGQVPDVILFAGVNGSGKTTLLEFVTDSLALISRPITDNLDAALPKSLAAEEALVEFEVESYEVPRARLRFIVGSREFVDANKTENCWWLSRMPNGGAFRGQRGNLLYGLSSAIEQWFPRVTIPSVVLLPSEDRTLIVPGESYKAAGKLAEDEEFVHRWRPPIAWKDSLEALLYSLRWEDLNAKEQAPFTRLSRFDAYAAAFRRFVGDSKYLRFEDGRLVVKIEGSAVAHDLAELSSGEKQVLLLSGELLRHWRPGSLILIDEPELHLHARWQTQLYEALRYWQKERGGQVILATQSAHLAELAGPGTAALLGVEPL